MKLENCWLVLPGHKVGYGDIKIEGGKIKEINHQPPTTSH